MSSTVTSRRSFLQLAGTGLALSGIGLGPAVSSAALPARAAGTGPVLLNFNESPYGPSPAAQAAARAIVADSGRYLFALAGELRDA
ncbi:MAG TPA: aminotransferase, partial [Stenotrophomonas sp.]|nr:aminotransferase [Stenotrophomonas sp.]